MVNPSPNTQPDTTPPTAHDAKPSKRKAPAPDTWASIRKSLNSWDQPQLLGLIHDLFKDVPEAKAAIVGRLMARAPLAAKAAGLDDLIKQVRLAVRPTTAMRTAEPNMRIAFRVPDQYFKVTKDADGAMLLYIEIIEQVIGLMADFGWDSDPVYNALYRAGDSAAKVVPTSEDPAALATIRTRLTKWIEGDHDLHGSAEDAIGTILDAIDERVPQLAKRD